MNRSRIFAQHIPKYAAQLFLLGSLACLSLVSACDQKSDLDPLALSDAGIGLLNENAPFAPEAIAELYPHLLIEAAEAVSEGEIYPIIRVSEADQELFTLIPGPERLTILRAEILNPLLVLDNGATIGDRFEDLLPPDIVTDIAPPFCDRGLEELAPFVICASPGYTRIYYVFEGTWNGPDDELPPRPTLNNWWLARIFWVP
jgi:hypothetical protein